MNSKGVMLVELLIAIAVFAIIAGAVSLNLFGLGRRQDLDSGAKSIVAFLRDAQARAIIQEENSEWGVHFEHRLSDDYYDLFKGTSYISSVSRKSLSSAIEFSALPATDIVFKKLSGCVLGSGGQCATLANSIVIKIKGASCPSEDCKTITVNPNGTISY